MTALPQPPAAAPLGRVLAGDLYRRELIGLEARIVRSCNPGIVGAAGRVVGETMNMLVLESRGPPGGRGGGGGASAPAAGGASAPRRLRRSYPKAGSVWRFRACAPAAAAAAPAPVAAGRGSAAAGCEAEAECKEGAAPPPPPLPPAYVDLDGLAIARRPEDRLRSRAPPAACAAGAAAGSREAGAA